MDRMNKIVFNDVTRKYLGSDDMASNSVCCLLKAIGDALKLKHNQSLLTPGYKWKVFNKLTDKYIELFLKNKYPKSTIHLLATCFEPTKTIRKHFSSDNELTHFITTIVEPVLRDQYRISKAESMAQTDAQDISAEVKLSKGIDLTS